MVGEAAVGRALANAAAAAAAAAVVMAAVVAVVVMEVATASARTGWEDEVAKARVEAVMMEEIEALGAVRAAG